MLMLSKAGALVLPIGSLVPSVNSTAPSAREAIGPVLETAAASIPGVAFK